MGLSKHALERVRTEPQQIQGDLERRPVIGGSPGETQADLFVSLGMTLQRGIVQVRSDGREIPQLGKSVASSCSDLWESHLPRSSHVPARLQSVNMMPLSSKTVDVGMSEIGLFDAIYTTSGVVGVKPDPVEEEKIKRILDAAIRAPSGNNAQP